MASEPPGTSRQPSTPSLLESKNSKSNEQSLSVAQSSKNGSKKKVQEDSTKTPEPLEGNKSRTSVDNKSSLEGSKSLVTKWKDDLLVPISKDNILYHYLPIHGVICYSAMSVNVMNPSLFAECCPKKDVTNFLLFGSVGGLGLYLYKRPHLQSLEEVSRIGYSAFGAVMFTFGSVLIWAVMRSILPGNMVAGSAFGLLSAAGLVKCGSSYCNAIDSQVGSSV